MTTMAMQRLVAVHLHGPLAQRFGRVHHLAVDSAAEAVRALCVLLQGFEDAVRGWHGPGHRVRVGEGERARWCDERTLPMSLGQARRVDIVPAVSGRKRNGTGQVIVGLILIVIGYFTSPYDGGATMKVGIAMLIGGAIALLTPMPKGSDSKAKEEASRALDGPPNITSAGGPVPLIIGRVMVGSVTVSAGLATDDVPIVISDPGAPELPAGEPLQPSEGSGGDGGDSGGAPGSL